MNIIDERRIGILRIKHQAILDAQPIFAEVIIVRCEYMAAYNHYEYHCYSKHFRPIVEGYIFPEYEAIIHEPSDDPTSAWVEFLEVK